MNVPNEMWVPLEEASIISKLKERIQSAWYHVHGTQREFFFHLQSNNNSLAASKLVQASGAQHLQPLMFVGPCLSDCQVGSLGRYNGPGRVRVCAGSNPPRFDRTPHQAQIQDTSRVCRFCRAPHIMRASLPTWAYVSVTMAISPLQALMNSAASFGKTRRR